MFTLHKAFLTSILTLTLAASLQLNAMNEADSLCHDLSILNIADNKEPKIRVYKYWLIKQFFDEHATEFPQEIVSCTIIPVYVHIAHVACLIDDIVTSFTHPRKLAQQIAKIIETDGAGLSLQILQLALEKVGKSICDIKDNHDKTVLHFAAFQGYTKVVKMLLALPDAHELIGKPDKNGKVALDFAQQKGDEKMITLLSGLSEPQELAV